MFLCYNYYIKIKEMNIIELDEKLIIAKLNDKIKACKTNNKIVNTEFLNTYKREIIQKELKILLSLKFFRQKVFSKIHHARLYLLRANTNARLNPL